MNLLSFYQPIVSNCDSMCNIPQSKDIPNKWTQKLRIRTKTNYRKHSLSLSLSILGDIHQAVAVPVMKKERILGSQSARESAVLPDHRQPQQNPAED